MNLGQGLGCKLPAGQYQPAGQGKESPGCGQKWPSAHLHPAGAATAFCVYLGQESAGCWLCLAKPSTATALPGAACRMA